MAVSASILDALEGHLPANGTPVASKGNPQQEAYTGAGNSHENPTEGQGIQFHLHGTVGDESRSAPVDETFFMAKDQAYNFAHEISTLLKKKFGAIQGNEITSLHQYYDKMFEDIRSKLGVKSGDPIKPEHLG